jgi:CrcB protein
VSAVLFAAAAGLAAVGRHAVGTVVCAWQALLVVNTMGAALLGYLVEAAPGATWQTALGAGLCGTFTTYSSFALEVRALGWARGSVYAGLTIGCVCGAAAIGVSLAAT